MTTTTSSTAESSLRGGYVRESTTPLGVGEYAAHVNEHGDYVSLGGFQRVPLAVNPANSVKAEYLKKLLRLLYPDGRVVINAGDGYVTEARSTTSEAPALGVLFLVGQCVDWESLAMDAARNAAKEGMKTGRLDGAAFEAVLAAKAKFMAAMDAAGAYSEKAYYAARAIA